MRLRFLVIGMLLITSEIHAQGGLVYPGGLGGYKMCATTPNTGQVLTFDGTNWCPASNAPSIPSGVIILSLTSCAAGFSEVSALNGKFLQGTIAANGDVGSTGGNATITPSGQVSQPTLAMNSYTPAGTNSTVSFTPAGANSTVSFTPAGTNSSVSFTPAGTNGATTTGATSAGTPAGTNSTATVATTSGSKAGSSAGAFTAIGGVAPGSSITVPAETFTGSAMATHTHTVPAETFTGSAGTVPAETFTGSAGTVPAETFTGSAGTVPAESFTGTPATLTGSISQPSFSGAAIDPRPQFTKVIFCQKI